MCILKLAKEAECGGDQRGGGAQKQMPPHTSCYYLHFLWLRIGWEELCQVSNPPLVHASLSPNHITEIGGLFPQ